MGAAVDTNGNYIIKDIPFGEYIIRCSFIGYPSKTDTFFLSEESNEINVSFSMSIPQIPIPVPDSLLKYHKTISQLDPSDILEIHIDSVSNDFNYT